MMGNDPTSCDNTIVIAAFRYPILLVTTLAQYVIDLSSHTYLLITHTLIREGTWVGGSPTLKLSVLPLAHGLLGISKNWRKVPH